MQHFFIEPSQAEGEWIRLNGSDVNHMKNVLRMHAGERVTVSDGAGKTYQCVIDSHYVELIKIGITETAPVPDSFGRAGGACTLSFGSVWKSVDYGGRVPKSKL